MIANRFRLLTALAAAAPAIAWGADAPAATAPTAEIKTLSCDGPFSQTATEESLKQAFGADNVVFKSVPGAEGMESNATVIFPDDPARTVTVFWWDETKRAKPSSVSIQADWGADSEGSDPWKTDILWQTPQGLRIGSTLEEVEAANGKPFQMSGFGWDYGGFATNFEGGALDTPEGACGFGFRFSPSAPTPDAATGDVELISSDAAVKASKPRLTEITIGYPVDESAPTP